MNADKDTPQWTNYVCTDCDCSMTVSSPVTECADCGGRKLKSERVANADDLRNALMRLFAAAATWPHEVESRHNGRKMFQTAYTCSQARRLHKALLHAKRVLEAGDS